MLYDYTELFNRKRIINKRLYAMLKDLYSKVDSNSGTAHMVKIVEVAAEGSTLTKTEVKTAFGTTKTPFSGVVKDTTNTKTYFVVFDGSKVDMIEL